MPTRTPAFFTVLDVSFQYGVTRSFHCHASISENSFGHGETIQLGCAPFGSPGGQPLNVITVLTSSAFARSTVRKNVS